LQFLPEATARDQEIRLESEFLQHGLHVYRSERLVDDECTWSFVLDEPESAEDFELNSYVASRHVVATDSLDYNMSAPRFSNDEVLNLLVMSIGVGYFDYSSWGSVQEMHLDVLTKMTMSRKLALRDGLDLPTCLRNFQRLDKVPYMYMMC
jgi:hypothetical protein